MEVHDRMPVIITGDDAPAWIDPAIDDPKALTAMLQPFGAKKMICNPVSVAVLLAQRYAISDLTAPSKQRRFATHRAFALTPQKTRTKRGKIGQVQCQVTNQAA
jgi:putative SOS response-associated peptidase YedK